jgi:hypothetical protein
MNMSSTENRGEALATQFFTERLVPASALLQARGARLLPDGPDSATASYYVTRPQGEKYVVDLTVPLEETLQGQWKEFPELADLVGDLLQLARELRQKEETGEVSPFIYAMF